jgi:hypothetical protein
VIYDLAAQKLPSVGDCIVVNRQWMNAHKDVTPDYPVVNAALFGDAVEQLSVQNDKIKSFDLNSMLDNEFVQSAMERKIGP